MNKMIVSVFDTESKAYEGLAGLKELHGNGDISLYATAVITKNESGNVHVKDFSDEGPIGTAVGMMSGAFVGLIGGPAGMAVGAAAGTLGGMFYDLDNVDIDASFVDEVSSALSKGKTAVIADVDEGWNAPIDNKMDALGGMVFRKNRNEVIDEQLNKEADALNAEIEELTAELKEANDDAKASIQKQIDKAKKKRHAMKEAIDNKMDAAKAQAEAKSKELNEQIKNSKEKAKAKLEKRKADLHASMEKSKEKLAAASKKVSTYFT